MPGAQLAATVVFAAVSSSLFGYVGWYHLRRSVEDAGTHAVRFFALWWLGLAATTLVGGLFRVGAAAGIDDLPLWTTVTYLNLGLLCASLLGLLYYLLYLYTGRRSLLVPLGLCYLVFYWALLYFVQAQHPIGIKTGEWTTTLDYASPITSGPLFAAIIVLLLVPQMLAAVAYFTLYFRTTDPEQRYRIALVSWSILLWFGISYFGLNPSIQGSPYWPVFTRFLGMGAALTTLLAYRPPGWVQRRLQAQRPGPGEPKPPQSPQMRREASQARVIIRRPIASRYSISLPDSS